MLREAETVKTLALEIGKKLFSFLLKPEEDLRTTSSLSDPRHGFPRAIEMRSWWRNVFQFDISTLEMLGKGSLDALGEHAAEGLLKTIHGEEGKAS